MTLPRPSLGTKIAAVLVMLALAGVAVYALFAPPTRVPGSAGSQAAPAQVAPSGGEEDGGGD